MMSTNSSVGLHPGRDAASGGHELMTDLVKVEICPLGWSGKMLLVAQSAVKFRLNGHHHQSTTSSPPTAVPAVRPTRRTTLITKRRSCLFASQGLARARGSVAQYEPAGWPHVPRVASHEFSGCPRLLMERCPPLLTRPKVRFLPSCHGTSPDRPLGPGGAIRP